MRAAVIERYGEPPVVKNIDEPRPDGKALIEVAAAPLNPVDLSIASGKFYQQAPPTPYVPGGEGIGRLLQSGQPGPRVYFRAALPHGALAERALTDVGQTVAIPDGVPDGVASALGTAGIAAYLSVTWRANLQPGETILVLGASGVLGSIAIQVARIVGAGRVIAGARDANGLARAKERGAEATVDLTTTQGLTERIREASGSRLDVVIDPLWGTPGVAALEALSVRGRFVQLGQSAGPEATVKSSILRGRSLSILGDTNFVVPWEEQAVAYRQLLEYAAAGRIAVEYEVLPLDEAPIAWKQQAASPHRKLVLSPRPSAIA